MSDLGDVAISPYPWKAQLFLDTNTFGFTFKFVVTMS